ncbi:MAG: M48 family metallopeptidase [Verrucomicrobiota bacterium]
MSLTLVIIFLVLLSAKTIAELYLSQLNRKEVQANADQIPEAFRDDIDEETYRKSVRYTLAKNAHNRIETIYSAIIIGLVVATGFLAWLFDALTGVLGTGVWGQALVLFSMMIVLYLPSIPFDYYDTFVLEEKFDFNTSSFGLWIMDKVKAFIFSVLIGVPVLALLFAIFDWLPNTWWFWGFVAFFVIQLLLMVLYPRVIEPFFYKLTPLEDGPLKERLLKLGERAGFSANTILVKDGSTRSKHSNAYFTGFGRFRKIVLYDTLVEQLEPIELESVLAHEIGHYKKGHIPKLLSISFITGLVHFAVMGWLATQVWFYKGFGFDPSSGMGPILLLFLILSSLITFWTGPLSNRLSRKYEFEADAFARALMGDDPLPLVKSLRKLNEKNLGNLTPHPTFSNFYYSHPTIQEREAALNGA